MDDCMKLINKKDAPRFIEKVTFAFLGLCAVLGWNAVMTSLKYFTQQFEEYNMGFTLPIPQLFANFLFGAMLPKIRPHIHIRTCIVGSLLAMSVSLIVIPFIASFLKNTIGGFLLMLFASFLLGMFNAFLQGAAVGLTNLVHGELSAVYWTFNGFSGILMNALYAISLLIFPDDLALGSIFYYAISVLFILVACYVFNAYYASMYSNSKGSLLSNSEIDDSGSNLSDSDDHRRFKQDKQHEINSKKNQKLPYFQIIVRTFKAGFPIPFMIWLHFFQLCLVFPGISVFKVNLGWSDSLWNGLYLITFANIADTIGKYSAGIIKKSLTLKLIISLVLFRFVLIGCMFWSAAATSDDSESFVTKPWFLILDIFVFSVLTGFCTSAMFQLAPMLLDNDKLELKEHLGFVNVTMLTFGVSCGSFAAFGFRNFGTSY